MTTNEKIKRDIQKLDVGTDLVSLYTLDATVLGGSLYRFTPMTENNFAVVFNGLTYSPLPVEWDDMMVTGDGRLPRPKLTVANVVLTFVALVNTYQDAVGAKVTRLRTFRRYLDSHAGADANATFPADVFYIEQKLSQNKKFISWELVTPIDVGDKMLPRGQVTAYCAHRYRVWRGGALNYHLATCPYVGAVYFDETGAATTIDGDKCGKRLSDCEKRFPLPSDRLPIKGFPGVGQVGRAYR